MLLVPPPGEPLGLYPLPVPQNRPGDFSWPPGIWLAIRRVQEFQDAINIANIYNVLQSSILEFGAYFKLSILKPRYQFQSYHELQHQPQGPAKNCCQTALYTSSTPKSFEQEVGSSSCVTQKIVGPHRPRLFRLCFYLQWQSKDSHSALPLDGISLVADWNL